MRLEECNVYGVVSGKHRFRLEFIVIDECSFIEGYLSEVQLERCY